MEGKYDAALLGILQSEGKIEKFLDTILGFLYRRTDYYRLMKSKGGKLGFPPGVALRMLCGTFQRYDDMTRKDDQLRESEKEKKRKEVANMETDVPVKEPAQNTKLKAKEDGLVKDASVEKDKSKSESSQKGQTNETKSDSAGTAKLDSGDSISDKNEKNQKDEDDDPELTKQQQKFQENSESYNGAVRDNYSWAQSITDLDLRVKVPPYISKGRDVKVDIQKKHVKVSHKDQEGQWVVVLDGDLTWDVHKEECIWSLNPGENVHINLEKKQERWWEAVLIGEPKISVRKIDASRPITDLDNEAQAKIEEMMYNDRQKKMGLPQSHEQKMHDMLRNAWDAEGSPFKGQEFDPSKFSVDPSGTVNMKPK